MTRRSPVPPQRWHVHSRFNGWITTSSGGRLFFTAKALALLLRQRRRDPTGAASRLDRRVAASADVQRLALGGAGDAIGLAREQSSLVRPCTKQVHGLGDPHRTRLQLLLEATGAALPPASECVAVKPAEPEHDIRGADIVLSRKGFFRGPADPLGMRNLVLACQGLFSRTGMLTRHGVSRSDGATEGQQPYKISLPQASSRRCYCR